MIAVKKHLKSNTLKSLRDYKKLKDSKLYPNWSFLPLRYINTNDSFRHKNRWWKLFDNKQTMYSVDEGITQMIFLKQKDFDFIKVAIRLRESKLPYSKLISTK